MRSDRLRGIGDAYLRLADTLEKILYALSVGIFALIITVLLGGVISRQIGYGVPVWYGESQRYLGMWATLLLAGPLVYRDRHFHVRLIHTFFRDRVSYYFVLFKHIPIFVVGLVLWNWGFEYTLGAGMASTASSMDIRMAWVYLILPITGLLIMFFSLARLIELVRDPESLATASRRLDEEEFDQEVVESVVGE